MLRDLSFEQELLRVVKSVADNGPDSASLGSLKPSEESTEEIETTQEQPQPNEVPAPPIPSKVSVKTLFSHPDTHPIIIDLALLQRYGTDWLEWEPDTVRHFTFEDLGPMSDLNFSKAMACKTLHLVDSYWKQWEVFNWCTMPFNSVFPDFQVMQVPTVAQCAVSVDVANRIRSDVEWSGEIKKFLEIVFRHDEIYCPQPPIDFVHVDVAGLPIDCPEISRLWPSVRVSKKAPKEDTITGEQLRRLLLVHEYLQESRDRLRSQLPLVQHV